MPLKYYKPTSPSQRNRVSLKLEHLCPLPDKPRWKRIKRVLHKGKSSTGGRNHKGLTTVRHRGGGHKRNYRCVLFRRDVLGKLLKGIPESYKAVANLKVEALVYDPNRSADLALLSYNAVEVEDFIEFDLSVWARKAGIFLEGAKFYFYILAPKNVKVGSSIPLRFYTSTGSSRREIYQGGESVAVQHVPLGSLVHNVEITRGRGGQVARAAGTYSQIVEIDTVKRKARVRLPSGEERWLLFGSYVTVGSVGNEDRRHVVLAKAGRSRWLSRRPKVRGVAMNPVDHPHGGGEGRTSGGRPSVTPWGRPTHNFRLRNKKANPFVLVESSRSEKRSKKKRT